MQKSARQDCRCSRWGQSREVRAALSRAEENPAGLPDADYLSLLSAEGTDLDALAAQAERVRKNSVGDAVGYVVNRNINITNVCYTCCQFCAFAQRGTDEDALTLAMPQVGDRVDEAWFIGATEICLGGIHPDLPGTAYFDLAREVKRRRPDMQDPALVAHGDLTGGPS
ncbi:2-iminoacetate synthase ThiH [Pseudarthrobacter sp. SLBN-100]|uniref:hypothetical protein n=1 Tax=Arthrobacter sp. SLBN-100 TaxID=2768450 RepID=UPI00190F136D|nr:hypothetical protein [Arthrobacter sp. SLBN-100]